MRYDNREALEMEMISWRTEPDSQHREREQWAILP